MTSAEAALTRELEIFRQEAEAGAQFFYSYLAVHELAKRQRRVFRMLDENALFWNTTLGGLQTGATMALGRIFDHQSPHNINTFVRLTGQHRTIFTKTALARRKQGPTPEDFRRLNEDVKKYRRLYEEHYRDVCNRLYAHKQAADPAAVAALVKYTSIRDLQRRFTFLLQLHETLRELFYNGTKPVLRP
jgi:hypothetical protein